MLCSDFDLLCGSYHANKVSFFELLIAVNDHFSVSYRTPVLLNIIFVFLNFNLVSQLRELVQYFVSSSIVAILKPCLGVRFVEVIADSTKLG